VITLTRINPPKVGGQAGNSKSQISNTKWFDKLTTLSQVEGQITMTEIQISKHLHDFQQQAFPVWVIGYWPATSSVESNLRFVCNLVLGYWILYKIQRKNN